LRLESMQPVLYLKDARDVSFDFKDGQFSCTLASVPLVFCN